MENLKLKLENHFEKCFNRKPKSIEITEKYVFVDEYYCDHTKEYVSWKQGFRKKEFLRVSGSNNIYAVKVESDIQGSIVMQCYSNANFVSYMFGLTTQIVFNELDKSYYLQIVIIENSFFNNFPDNDILIEKI